MFWLFGKKERNIAILVDGPNTIRKGTNIDLAHVRRELGKYGKIRIAKVYLDQYASEKLIEAVVNQGYDPEITTGDVDVTMAIEGMEYLLRNDVDILALMTRDTDYRPLLIKAREHGKLTMILATEHGFSTALKNTADAVIIFWPNGTTEHLKNNPKI